MANETTNIGLRKPVPTENFDIDRDFNANWDKIDTEIKGVKDAKDALEQEVVTARGTESTLGERLDSTDLQLVKIENVQNSKLKNEIVNGDFSQGTSGWILWGNASLTNENRFFKISNGKILLDGYNGGNGRIGQDVTADIYDKFYIKAEVLGSSDDALYNIFTLSDFGSATNLNTGAVSSIVPTQNPKFSTTFTNPKDNGFRIDLRYNAGVTYVNRTFDNLLLINLTKSFGSGNEPTKEEMDMLLEMIPNGWWDGELSLTQKQIVDWLLKLGREKANKVQEKWITPTLLNGWTGTAQYMKDDFGFVHFRGTLSSGVISKTAFELPLGYRPPSNMIWITNSAYANFATGFIGVWDGAFTPNKGSSADLINLHQISFYAEV